MVAFDTVGSLTDSFLLTHPYGTSILETTGFTSLPHFLHKLSPEAYRHNYLLTPVAPGRRRKLRGHSGDSRG